MFHEKIKNLRKKKGVTGEFVANAVGLSESAYRNYERGVREPNFETLSKLADFYGVTTDYLLGREPKEPEPDPFADIGLDENAEAEMWELYKTFPPEARAMCMDMLVRLGDIARKKQTEQQPAEPKKERHTATLRELQESATEEEAKKGA